MWVLEAFINRTRGYSFGESDWYESYHDTTGSLFRAMQREYGRCTSRMYMDRPSRFDGPSSPVQVGWVFEKVMTYEDARPPYGDNDRYVREVWVQVSSTEPKREVHTNNITSPWLGK